MFATCLLFLICAVVTVTAWRQQGVRNNRQFINRVIKSRELNSLHMFNGGGEEQKEDTSMKYIQPDVAPPESTDPTAETKKGFPVDFGKVLSIGLYGYIGYLVVDTLRIVITHQQQ